MRHAIFARDRRRKKNRIKVMLFFGLVILMFVGIVFSLKNQSTLETARQGTYFSIDENEGVILEEGPLEQTALFIEASDELSESVIPFPEGMLFAIETAIDSASPLIGFSITDYISTLTFDPNESESGDTTSSDDPNATAYYEDEDAVDDIDSQVKKGEKLSEEAESLLSEFLDVASQAMRISEQFSHQVAKGDKLKDILELSGLEESVAKSLIKSYPELNKLSTGQQFYWVLDKEGNLESLSWLVSEKEEQVFELTDKGTYRRQKIEKKGVWKKDVVTGSISGDFTSSLKSVGLSQRQINQLASGLQWQIATNRFKKGDKFAILVNREYINGKVTGIGNVEAIRVSNGGKNYFAIQADNGRYYNRNGETLGGKGFARYPLQFSARVSSGFNPRRRHPITGRVRPHNGTDFALPIGTPIIAPSDGVVEHVGYQAKGAGRYIKIRHSGQYETVYMHLSRSLVKVGQSVKRGQRIALSGNTGGSTGPHLHYEFHINGRPVNPMTVKLPGGSNSGMSDRERRAFLAKAKTIENRLK